MVAVGWNLKIGSGFCNPWQTTFLSQNNYLMHNLLAKVQKNNKFKIFFTVGWKLKIGSRFGNPRGPISLAKNNYFMHRLLARVQKIANS